MWFHGLVRAEEGKFQQLKEIIKRLFHIGEDYDYNLAIAFARSLKAVYLLKLRTYEAIIESNELLSGQDEQITEIQEMMFMGYKAEAQFLLGDTTGAMETISKACAVFEKQRFLTPTIAAPFLVARFLVDLGQLMQSSDSMSKTDIMIIRKKAYYSGKAAVRNSRKYAPYRTKILRLMGLYYWLIGKQGKALKWWNKAIQEGESLGARPDLSRTYFEIGKRFLEPQSRYKELNGVKARGYLEKAKAMFEDMDLQRDLDQLDKIVSDS
jgi:hypothetical protein